MKLLSDYTKNKNNFLNSLRFFREKSHLFFRHLLKDIILSRRSLNICLFPITLLCISFAFYGNYSSSFVAISQKVAEDLNNNDYSGFVTQSSQNFSSDGETYNIWKSTILSCHEGRSYSRGLSCFLANGSSTDDTFLLSSFDSASNSEGIKIIDFADYNRENASSDYFAFGQINKYSKDIQNLGLTNFSFDGRTGGSYISLGLAQKIASKKQCSLDQLLGGQFSISNGLKSYFFSINNIFVPKSGLGACLSLTLGDNLIITNAQTFWKDQKITSFLEVISDQLVINNFLESLRGPTKIKENFIFSFLLGNQQLKMINYSDEINNAISSSSLSFWDYTNLVWFILALASASIDVISSFLFQFWSNSKMPNSNSDLMYIDLFSLALFYSVLFLIFGFQSNLILLNFINFSSLTFIFFYLILCSLPFLISKRRYHYAKY